MLLNRWIPAAVLVAALLATGLIWRTLVSSERAALESHLDAAGAMASGFLRDELENQAQAILRLAIRRELFEGDQSAWEKDAQLLIDSHPAFMGVALAGPGLRVISTVPSGGRTAAARGPEAAEAIATAASSGSPAVSSLIDMGQGRRVFVMAVPVPVAAGQPPVAAGIFDAGEFARRVLSDSRHELEGHAISLSSGGVEVYSMGEASTGELLREGSVEGMGTGWKVTVWPGPGIVSGHLTSLPVTIFALGATSSVLLSALIFFAQVNRLKARDLEAANEMLKAEVRHRARTEEELRGSNERLERSQRIARLGSWAWDIEKDELQCSEETYRILGVESDTLRPAFEKFMNLVHPDDRAEVRRCVAEALELRRPCSVEFKVELAGGVLKFVHAQGEVEFDASGRAASMSGTMQDITERKLMDEQLRLYREHLRELVDERTAELNELNEKLRFEVEIRKKAEEAVTRMNEDLEARAVELERVNRELEAFTYSASHDLQEPLRVISGYVQLLGRRYRGRLDSEADEFITYAVDGVARMQRLISDLLSYSRVGRLGSLAPVDLGTSLERVCANLRVAIDESGAVVRGEGLPTVLADASQIDQLLMNLVSNAIKYRGADAPLVTVNATRRAAEWVISVSDNGLGIDPKYSEKVFEIFQRLHRDAEYPGTGIGLSICKKVVENHGGRIWVESLPGAGSTFYFTIPGKEAAGG